MKCKQRPNKLLPIIYVAIFALCLLTIPSVAKNLIFFILTAILILATIQQAKKHPKLTQKQQICLKILGVVTALLLLMLIISISILIATQKTLLLSSNFVTIGMEIISIGTALLANFCFKTKSFNYALYAIYINYGIVLLCFIIAQVFHLDTSSGILQYIVKYDLETHELAFVAGVAFVYLLANKDRKDRVHLLLLSIILLLCFKRISLFALVIVAFFLFLQKKTQLSDKKILLLNKITNYLIVFGFLIFMLVFFDSTIHFLTKNLGINMNWRDQFYGYILSMPSPYAPLFGAGIRSTDYYLSLNPKIGFISAIHSDILRVYLENGLIFFSLYFILFITFISNLIKKATHSIRYELVYQMVLTYTFVCFTTDNLFTYYKFIFMLFVIIFDIITSQTALTKGAHHKKKNLLVIDHCVDVVGGVERILCALSNHFIKKYNVTVLSENKFTDQSFFTYNSKVNKCYLIDRTRDPFHGKGGRNKISYLLEKFANRISRIGERERLVNFLEETPEVDVIIFGRIFTALRFLPAIEQYYTNTKRPRIIVRDAIHLLDLKGAEQDRMKNLFPNLVDTLIVSSDESLKAYRKFFGKEAPTIIKIYNPLSIEPLAAWHGYQNKTITAIGRIDDKQKGFDTLTLAFRDVIKAHPDWHLDLYGNGSAKSNIETIINNENIPNVLVKPYTKNIVDVFNQTSIFVFPSRYEGYANTLVEALACGIPAITYNWYMGSEEIITHNKNGVIVKLDNRLAYFHGQTNDVDVKHLAQAINNLIDGEKQARAYSKNAIKICNSRNADKIFQQWDKLLTD